jgi:hypothetical protein
MASTIINKKQFISVRGYWFQGGPGGPACTIKINGAGVGTYSCPVPIYNTCVFSTVRTYGAGISEGTNYTDAPRCGDISIVRGNMAACYATSLKGKDTYPGALTYSNQNFTLPYLNTQNPMTVEFSWSASSCWPNCCVRPSNTDTLAYNYGYTHGVWFDIAYLYADASSTFPAGYSNNYKSLITWGFSNYKEMQTNCSSTFERANSCGGINNGVQYGCLTSQPANPNLTSVTIPCPSCG